MSALSRLQVVLAVALSVRLRPSSVLEYDLYAGGPRPPLRVQGAQLVRSADGKEVELRGVNCEYMQPGYCPATHGVCVII